MIHHCLPWVGIPPNFSVKHTFPRPCSVISWQRNLRCPFRISVCNCLSTPVLSQTRLVVCKVRKTYTVPQILNKMTSSVQCSSKHTKGRTEKHSFSCQIQTMSCVLPRWYLLLVRCDAHAPECLVLIRGTLCKKMSANVNWMCSGFKVFRHKSKIRLFTKSKKTTLGVSAFGCQTSINLHVSQGRSQEFAKGGGGTEIPQWGPGAEPRWGSGGFAPRSPQKPETNVDKKNTQTTNMRQ